VFFLIEKKMRATLLLAACLVAAARESPLLSVPDRGGFALNDVVFGKSDTVGVNGEPYYFFAFNPDKDIFVSKSMLVDKGGWEPQLNELLVRLLRREPDARSKTVLDVGANIGAFSLFAAAQGVRVWSFEMQPRLCTLLELSRKVNGFYRMKVFNAALWNETGKEVTFTPVEGNFGGTSLVSGAAGGTHKMLTRRLDEIFRGYDVFFMKIDVENAEEYVLKGMHRLLERRRVKHFLMEHRPNQVHLVDWFYDMGYRCSLPESAGTSAEANENMWTLDAARRRVLDAGLGDIYCTVGAAAPDSENRFGRVRRVLT